MDSDSENIISPTMASETPILSPPPPVTANDTYQHDMFDPYFMHPSDNPSVTLVSPPQTTICGHVQ